MGKPEGKRPLGRQRHRWEDNIKWVFKKWDLGGGGLDWIDLAQDTERLWVLENPVTKLQVPYNMENFLTS